MSAADVAVRVPVLLIAVVALAFLACLVYAAVAAPRRAAREEARFGLGLLVVLAVLLALIWGLANGGEVW